MWVLPPQLSSTKTAIVLVNQPPQFLQAICLTTSQAVQAQTQRERGESFFCFSSPGTPGTFLFFPGFVWWLVLQGMGSGSGR